MAERLQGRRVIVVDGPEYRTLVAALRYTVAHENRGDARARAKALLVDLEGAS